ncbi:MAG: aminotransferase class I/II-fold pyridoxal phosphate-dependent enzyme [Clostridia bacterium]|nr:aminotransferase class I/II-fold pyridoxal phosphate-dependent enzyme [Clostridia bacterium]
MLSFDCDYTAGAHPAVLESLIKTNMEPLPGYGEDKYCMSAREKIKAACAMPEAEVHFLTGGTQTNSIIISALLHPCEGVISAATGHVNVHEGGAIEATGHKVLTLPAHAGKLDARELETYMAAFRADEAGVHMVQPGMVYISHPTEYGTLYSRAELSELHAICRKYSLPLFIDGARLGYALESLESDLALPDIARLCDVFYIGGTKVGALCGEAVVFTGMRTPKFFTTFVKQHGALLAKGRLLGVQFDTLFTGGLYFEISRHAIACAEKMKRIFRKKGYTFFMETPTNQQFVLLENEKMASLAEKVRFCFWEKAGENNSAVRFATSWSTTEEDLAELEKIL